MPQFGRNGWPVGSVVQVLRTDDKYKEAIGKQYKITYPLHFNTKYQTWMYCIDFPIGNCDVSYIPPDCLKFVKLPLNWENWCRNKVLLLCGYNDDIFKQLVHEIKQGNTSDYGGKDCTYEIFPKGKGDKK